VVQRQDQDFTTAGNTGKKFQAVGNTLQHVAQADDLFDQMGNGQYPTGNQLKNIWSTATGGEKPLEFKTVAGIAATETAKALHGAGALSQDEVNYWQNRISSAASPQQMHGVLAELVKAINVQEQTAYNGYRVGTQGIRDYQGPRLLSDEARAAGDKVIQRAQQAQAPAQSGAAAPAGGGVITFERKNGKIVPVQ
jgi:hypothetical protein